MPLVIFHREGQTHQGEVADNSNLVVKAAIEAQELRRSFSENGRREQRWLALARRRRATDLAQLLRTNTSAAR